jgi:hypothetical protein
MGAAGASRVAERFSLATQVASIERVYAADLAGRRSRPVEPARAS